MSFLFKTKTMFSIAETSNKVDSYKVSYIFERSAKVEN